MASIKYAAHVAATADQPGGREDSKKSSMFNTPVSEWSRVPPSLKSHTRSKSTSKSSQHHLSDRERQRRAELAAQAREKREALIRQIRCEKKLMFISSCLAVISSLVWIVAVSTDFWYHVTVDPASETVQNAAASNVKVFVSSHTGLWRTCRTIRSNGTDETWCKPHTLFADRDQVTRDPALDKHVIDYTRTVTIFAVTSLFTMILSCFAAFYTFKNSRYMYKRLASGLYFITTLAILVVLEATITWVKYAEQHVPFNHPEGSTTRHGFSFFMGWAVFFVYLFNGCEFLVLSRKRKDENEFGSLEDGHLTTSLFAIASKE